MVTLPQSSDMMRSEARFIRDAAERVAEQMMLVHDAVRDAHARINETISYVDDLDRHGSIDHSAASEIRLRLKPKE